MSGSNATTRGRPRRHLDGPPPRPTRDELLAADGLRIPDLIAPGLDVLFCGINPGRYSGATGLHFARPGNRFWRALHEGGFTPTLLQPWHQQAMLDAGFGITNLAGRTTATAADLDDEELRRGRIVLARKVARYKPRAVAIVGIGAYRVAFNRPRAVIGPQPDPIGTALAWLLPSPSGLNANHQAADLAEAFAALRCAIRGRSDWSPAGPGDAGPFLT
ncbi:MAG: G/U mismatch-specific DNA glycosylase [Acidobacteria bacterium]|nr:G/U mismatch-specific DNA glycosylase [Acidobacteriota bacterium]